MSRAATDSVTVAFADAESELYGIARLGLTAEGQGSALALLFSGRVPVAALARGGLEVGADASLDDDLELGGVRMVHAGEGSWTASLRTGEGQGFELAFGALGGAAEVAELGGMAGTEQPCHVRGTVMADGQEVAFDGLGQRSRAWGDPDWERIELARTVAAWTGAASAALTAVRPAGAANHGDERSWAAVWEDGGLVAIEDGRLSTTYDADGHTRRAGLELWPPGDEAWPRRAAGEVLCGSSLDLGALRLDCAFFRWHLEGRAGVGRYDILRKAA